MSEKIRREQIVRDADALVEKLEELIAEEAGSNGTVALTIAHTLAGKVRKEMQDWLEQARGRPYEEYDEDSYETVLIVGPRGGIERMGHPDPGEKWIPLPLSMERR